MTDRPTEADWLRLVDGVLKGADFEKTLVGRTADGLRIAPLHRRRPDAAVIAGARAGRPWRVIQRVDHPDPDAAARLALDDLEGGADGLALVFAAAQTARGYGLACETLDELDRALDGVRLDLIQTRLEPSPGGRIHAALFAALVRRRNLSPDLMRVSFGMDPIGVLAHLGLFSADWPEIGRRLTDSIRTLADQGFQGPFLACDTRPAHEAGAGEAEELAVALATGVAYLRALDAAGLPPGDPSATVEFTVAVDADLLLGVAKLRALRRLWARVQAVSATPVVPISIHAETACRMLTKRDPQVNLLRGTVAAFAAGVGGADTVTVLPHTAALGLPDGHARRLARNTSHLLIEESQLWHVADPAAGAGGFEALTDDLCATAWGLFQEIEREGGIVASLTGGHLQRRIAATRADRQRALATRRAVLTGTSAFPDLAETAPPVLDVEPSRAMPPKLRTGRPDMPFAEVAAAFGRGARRNDVTPPPMDRITAEPLPSLRLAEPFEALRDRADAFALAHGRRPAVRLVVLGTPAAAAPRLGFARDLFAIGGFETMETAEGPAALVCLCGSDEAYAGEAGTTAPTFTAAGSTVWLAGRPGAQEDTWRAAGISRFVFAGCDAIEALDAALTVVGG